MPKHFRIDDELTAEHRAALELLARKPSTRLVDLVDWLRTQGYEIPQSSVHRWRRNFKEQLEGITRAGELAKAFAAVAQDGESGVDRIGEANLMRFAQLLQENLFAIESGGEISSDQLVKLSAAVNNTLGHRLRADKLAAEIARIKADTQQKRKDTREAVERLTKRLDQADRAVAAGKTVSSEVFAAMRRELVALGEEEAA